MFGFWEQIKRLCKPNAAWVAMFCALCLTFVGIYAIDTTHAGKSDRQLLWLGISLCMMFFCCLPSPKTVSDWSVPIFWVVVLLLVFVLLPFVPESIVKPLKGARSRINFQFMKFQPSEIAKFTFVLALAWYFRYRKNYRELKGLLMPFAIMFLPVILILKQPDLGSAIIFGPAFLVVLLAAGCKLKHLITILLLGGVVMGLNVAVILYDPPHEYVDGKGKLPGWAHVMKGHQEKRIAAMLWAKRYQDREGFQQDRGIRLLSAGGIWGYETKERSAQLIKANALPEEHNDMIYCVIVNRWGLVGGLVVIGLNLVMTLSLLVVVARLRDPFMRLATVGMVAIFFGQAVIHIGVNVRLIPNTGITLPFVSYGGSSLMAGFMMMGLILNFASRRPGRLMRPSFEFDGDED